jgi:Endonuclease NucS
MVERSNIESTIRDWLADHLDFIAPRLKLIQKEYYLPDEIGARGFVDLLCEDEYCNFVVIEIKRSDASARQTISEVLKYHALIKHNFGARESEIRTIVISTHWNELIRPFSETVYRTTLDLTGYEITLGEDKLPKAITKIEPLNVITLSRHFAYWYGLYMFETNKQRVAFYSDFESYLLEKEFKDFVLVKAVGDLTDKKVIYPYGVIVAFQQMSLTELPEAIKKLDEEEFEYLDDQEEFDNENDYHSYLEGEMINILNTSDHDYESEACYPQKVNSMQQSENWQIEHIKRFGIFSKDPRYSDEQLISELSGLDGNSENAFFGISESTQAEKIKEIRENCRYSLKQSPVWLETIEAIFEGLNKDNRKFRITLHIYNPDSLMVAIYHTVSKKELNYLPTYFLSIDYLEESLSEIYHGAIKWNGNGPISTFLKPFPKNEDGTQVFELHTDPDNVQDAQEMSLGYTTAKFEITGQETKFQGFLEGKNRKLVRQGEFLFPFAQFAVTYQAQLETFIKNFNRSYVMMIR